MRHRSFLFTQVYQSEAFLGRFYLGFHTKDFTSILLPSVLVVFTFELIAMLVFQESRTFLSIVHETSPNIVSAP